MEEGATSQGMWGRLMLEEGKERHSFQGALKECSPVVTLILAWGHFWLPELWVTWVVLCQLPRWWSAVTAATGNAYPSDAFSALEVTHMVGHFFSQHTFVDLLLWWSRVDKQSLTIPSGHEFNRHLSRGRPDITEICSDQWKQNPPDGQRLVNSLSSWDKRPMAYCSLYGGFIVFCFIVSGVSSCWRPTRGFGSGTFVSGTFVQEDNGWPDQGRVFLALGRN